MVERVGVKLEDMSTLDRTKYSVVGLIITGDSVTEVPGDPNAVLAGQPTQSEFQLGPRAYRTKAARRTGGGNGSQANGSSDINIG